MIDLLLVSQLTPLIYTPVNCSLSIMSDTHLLTGPLDGLTAVESTCDLVTYQNIWICRKVCVITATGDVTPADSLRCNAVAACKLPPHFLISSTPLPPSSSFTHSLQPSPSYQCLIHFPSNSLRAPWFICLWSLLTLSNTFPFFPPSPSSSALFWQSPWVQRGISITFPLFDDSLSLPLMAAL